MIFETYSLIIIVITIIVMIITSQVPTTHFQETTSGVRLGPSLDDHLYMIPSPMRFPMKQAKTAIHPQSPPSGAGGGDIAVSASECCD